MVEVHFCRDREHRQIPAKDALCSQKGLQVSRLLIGQRVLGNQHVHGLGYHGQEICRITGVSRSTLHLPKCRSADGHLLALAWGRYLWYPRFLDPVQVKNRLAWVVRSQGLAVVRQRHKAVMEIFGMSVLLITAL